MALAGAVGVGADPDVFGSLGSNSTTITPLTTQSAATIPALQGFPTGSVLLATFSQGSATQSASAYTALVDWGDDQGDISTEPNSPLSIEVSGQTILVYGSHTYATSGTFTPSVTLFTNNTESTATPTINVAPFIPGVYTVTLTTDDGNNTDPMTGELRWAIIEANSNPGSTIDFDVNGGGAQTIDLVANLPQITAQVTIDGTSQPTMRRQRSAL